MKKVKDMNGVVVKSSLIHGKGVFALRDFKQGEVVLRWNAKELTKKEFEKLSKKEKRYVEFSEGKYLLMQSQERYVNHSCDANTFARNLSDVAKRNIKKGEEITANYGEPFAPREKMECKCGSRKCREVIVSIASAK